MSRRLPAISLACCGALLLVGLPAGAARADPIIAAAGDISCSTDNAFYNGGLGDENHCAQGRTDDLLEPSRHALVLPLGDLQYNTGSLAKFQAFYDPTWGQVKDITRPAIGNHEYDDPGAAGYFDYFNGVGNQTGPVGDRSQGYYSFDVPLPSGKSWHLVSLNSQCADPDAGISGQLGACDAGSPQEQWLRSDLATHPADCTLAYWHHPPFSSSENFLPGPEVAPLWRALQEAGVELVLVGHHHHYERFAPQDADGIADPNGVREFIVGTGGHSHFAVGDPVPNSEVQNDDTFGILELTLHDASYEWSFVPEAGDTYTDSGSAACSLNPSVEVAARPSNEFRLGKLKRNRERGTATLAVHVPGAGELALYGKRVKRTDKDPGGAGKVTMPIRLKGSEKEKLDPAVRVRVKVSFTPAGGDLNTQSKPVRLVKRD